jgi:hypothetical protein
MGTSGVSMWRRWNLKRICRRYMPASVYKTAFLNLACETTTEYFYLRRYLNRQFLKQLHIFSIKILKTKDICSVVAARAWKQDYSGVKICEKWTAMTFVQCMSYTAKYEVQRCKMCYINW